MLMPFIVMLFVGAATGDPRLEALAQIETGNNNHLIGSRGEISAYQILPSTWKQFTNLPLKAGFHSQEEAALVAGTILNNYSSKFYMQTGRQPSARDLYVLWNCGPNTGYKGDLKGMHRKVRDAAKRYENLYHKYASNN